MCLKANNLRGQKSSGLMMTTTFIPGDGCFASTVVEPDDIRMEIDTF